MKKISVLTFASLLLCSAQASFSHAADQKADAVVQVTHTQHFKMVNGRLISLGGMKPSVQIAVAEGKDSSGIEKQVTDQLSEDKEGTLLDVAGLMKSATSLAKSGFNVVKNVFSNEEVQKIALGVAGGVASMGVDAAGKILTGVSTLGEKVIDKITGKGKQSDKAQSGQDSSPDPSA